MRMNQRTRTRAATLLFALAACTAGACTTSGGDFERREQQARDNLDSKQGADYDYKLGTTLEANPAVVSGMSRCLEEHPGKHELHGYFHFDKPDAFRVVLRPETAFSACLAAAFEGHAVPAPPSVPYFNHFTFRTEQ